MLEYQFTKPGSKYIENDFFLLFYYFLLLRFIFKDYSDN